MKKEQKTQDAKVTEKEAAAKEKPQEPAPEKAGETPEQSEKKEIETVTLKFGKGCVGNEFKGKDGIDYKEIAIPNKSPDDKRPWKTFVVKASRVHENKCGKGMWCTLPADGSTTVKRSVYKGKDENGKSQWEDQKEKIPNRELKALVEFYKERPRDTIQDKIAGKQEQIAQKEPAEKTAKTKALQEAL
ncbi:MAG: hypothetical protein IK078_09785 [Lachnospiraceae bacterium]|nr:hypothetical protein [Lachnospiraceae bacterium]